MTVSGKKALLKSLKKVIKYVENSDREINSFIISILDAKGSSFRVEAEGNDDESVYTNFINLVAHMTRVFHDFNEKESTELARVLDKAIFDKMMKKKELNLH